MDEPIVVELSPAEVEHLRERQERGVRVNRPTLILCAICFFGFLAVMCIAAARLGSH